MRIERGARVEREEGAELAGVAGRSEEENLIGYCKNSIYLGVFRIAGLIKVKLFGLLIKVAIGLYSQRPWQ